MFQRLTNQVFQRSRGDRKLELLETQQLGEKRFVAIVRVGKQKFLIGGASSSVSLLAEVDSQKTTIMVPRPFDQETA
jgi:flagellar biogenesis protein FliO